MSSDVIEQNLARVRGQIADAAKKSGRDGADIRLCAVSKFHPAQDVLDAIAAGQLLFGENRVQEAEEKFRVVAAAEPRAQLHIIGTLQRNKVKRAVQVASCIQSVDRAEVLADIQRHAHEAHKHMAAMLEVHTGEDSKAGFATADDVWRVLERAAGGEFADVTLTGLMTMAPFTDDEARVRASFSFLRGLRDEALRRFPGIPLTELSMGMSGDFALAIEEGSTLVRIGTAIFGSRGVPA